MPHLTNDEYQMMISSLAKTALETIVGKPESLPVDSTNPYEMAGTRYSAMMAADAILRAVTDEMQRQMNEAFENAAANLRKYEKAPGIPKDEYQWKAWNEAHSE